MNNVFLVMEREGNAVFQKFIYSTYADALDCARLAAESNLIDVMPLTKLGISGYSGIDGKGRVITWKVEELEVM